MCWFHQIPSSLPMNYQVCGNTWEYKIIQFKAIYEMCLVG